MKLEKFEKVDAVASPGSDQRKNAEFDVSLQLSDAVNADAKAVYGKASDRNSSSSNGSSVSNSSSDYISDNTVPIGSTGGQIDALTGEDFSDKFTESEETPPPIADGSNMEDIVSASPVPFLDQTNKDTIKSNEINRSSSPLVGVDPWEEEI